MSSPTYIACDKCHNVFLLGEKLMYYTADNIPLCTPCADELGF